MLLTLSIVALIIGPLLISFCNYNRKLDNFLFAFVLSSVGGLLIIDVLPQIWGHIGFMLIPMVALGFFGPGLIELSFKKAADKAHGFALLLGVLGLILHATIDGAAVIETQEGPSLAFAVILHRLIVGLGLWWMVQPLWGNLRASLVLVLMSISTLIGFYLGEQQLLGLHNPIVDYFQALVSGTLLHVIIHRPHVDDHGHVHDHHHGDGHQHDKHGFVVRYKSYFSAGFGLGLITLIILLSLHH